MDTHVTAHDGDRPFRTLQQIPAVLAYLIGGLALVGTGFADGTRIVEVGSIDHDQALAVGFTLLGAAVWQIALTRLQELEPFPPPRLAVDALVLGAASLVAFQVFHEIDRHYSAELAVLRIALFAGGGFVALLVRHLVEADQAGLPAGEVAARWADSVLGVFGGLVAMVVGVFAIDEFAPRDIDDALVAWWGITSIAAVAYGTLLRFDVPATRFVLTRSSRVFLAGTAIAAIGFVATGCVAMAVEASPPPLVACGVFGLLLVTHGRRGISVGAIGATLSGILALATTYAAGYGLTSACDMASRSDSYAYLTGLPIDVMLMPVAVGLTLAHAGVAANFFRDTDANWARNWTIVAVSVLAASVLPIALVPRW